MSHPEMPYTVIRSNKRRKTVQARVVSGVAEIRIPAAMSAAEERAVVAEMLGKLQRGRRGNAPTDAELLERASALNAAYLDGRAVIGSIRWVGNQNTRWGSCTSATGAIRISDRLKAVPDYVLDAVIVHELTHTFVPGHGAEFWRWADRVPHAERAKGYLEAYQCFGQPAGAGG